MSLLLSEIKSIQYCQQVLDEMAEATAATTSRENHSLLDEDTKEDYDNFPPKKRSRGIKIVRALRVKLSGAQNTFMTNVCGQTNKQITAISSEEHITSPTLL